MSDPDVIISTAEGLKDSTSTVIPEVDNRKALMPPSSLAVPPPLPPKRHQRLPAFEKPLSQGPHLKAFDTRDEPVKSLACRTSPVLGGVKENNQFLGIVPGEVPDMHNSCTLTTLSKVEPKCQTQFSPRPLLKSPMKPPRPNKPKRTEREEGKQQEAEWRKLKEKLGDKKNKQAQDPTGRNQKMEDNQDTSRIESHLDMGKPQRQILVLFTDMEKCGEEVEDRGKEDEDQSNIWLTTQNSSLLAMKCSDLTPDEEPDIAPTNGNCTFTVSAKPEPTVPPQPPPKSHRKCSPKPPIKPPRLFSATRSEIEDEQWRDKDLVDKERDEKEGEGKDRGKVNGDTESTSPSMREMPSQLGEIVMSIPKSSVNEEVELSRGGQKFCLKSPSRDRPLPVITAETETIHHESQNPKKQHQDKSNEQVLSVPLPQGVPARVKPIWTDMEALRWTENNKEILSGQEVQDSEKTSKLPLGHLEGTEVVVTKLGPCQLALKRLEDTREIAETLSDEQLKQTNQKTNARGKMQNAKQLAKKVIGRWKEGRDERRRTKVLQMEMDGVREDDIELTQDERRRGEEGEMDEEKEKGMDEVAVDQSAVTDTQSHANLMERRIKRRNATSESSFKVCSPVKLVQELLSGDEWSQFLHRDQSSNHDPAPRQTHSDENFQFDSGAELDLPRDVFEGSPAVPDESIYEDVDLSYIITEEMKEMNRATAAIPQILLDSETNPMSPRTKDIYDTVELIQPVQPANTLVNLPDIKSQGVLDSAAQKYLIKLSKKRKCRAAQKQRRHSSHETRGQSLSSTSPQVFSASIFYNVPASGGEEPLTTVKSGGSSPRSLAKIKTALKDKTLLRAAQPKEDRG